MWSRGFVGIHFGLARFLRVYETHLGFLSLSVVFSSIFFVVHVRCSCFYLSEYRHPALDVWQEAEVAC